MGKGKKTTTYRIAENGLGGGVPDAIDILQGVFNALLVGNFDTTHTSCLNLQGSASERSLHAGSSSRGFDRGSRSESIVAADGLQGKIGGSGGEAQTCDGPCTLIKSTMIKFSRLNYISGV